jgi:hypothetical protein
MASLDDFVEKIGEAAGVVVSTTEKAVSKGKIKYNIAAEENKINKCYNELGRIYFEMVKEDENADFNIKELIKNIELSSLKIGELKAELEKPK